jgi:hypothetical protein
MKFDELDARIRIYETAHDQWVLPGIHHFFPGARLSLPGNLS